MPAPILKVEPINTLTCPLRTLENRSFFFASVSASWIKAISDSGIEAGLNVVLDEGIHDTHEKNTDHDADDDTDGLIDIELGFGIGNGSLHLAVDLVALVVDGFLRAIEEVFDFVEHVFLPFRF